MVDEVTQRSLGDGEPSSMNERRQLRKSGDLDLRLSTALDDVMAGQGARTRLVDSTSLEGSTRSDPPTSVETAQIKKSNTVEAVASPNKPAISEVDPSSELATVPTSSDSSSVSNVELEVEAGPGDSIPPESARNQEIEPVNVHNDLAGNDDTPAAEQKVDTDASDERILEGSKGLGTISSAVREGETESSISSDDEASSLLGGVGLESNSVQEMVEETEASEESEGPSALYSEFVRRYINAAIKGNVGAQATLGYFYEIGEHVEADVRESIRWYEKAASNGHLQATLRLAEIEIAAGNGKAGVSWYEKAAIQGDMDAQAMLGYFYQTGEHVTADLAVAIKWYLAAADQDHIAAQNNLGRLYQIGEGVAKDLDQAIYWYERAAKNGSDAAARNLQKLLP
jgi:TPR repeat protein